MFSVVHQNDNTFSAKHDETTACQRGLFFILTLVVKQDRWKRWTFILHPVLPSCFDMDEFHEFHGRCRENSAFAQTVFVFAINLRSASSFSNSWKRALARDPLLFKPKPQNAASACLARRFHFFSAFIRLRTRLNTTQKDNSAAIRVITPGRQIFSFRSYQELSFTSLLGRWTPLYSRATGALFIRPTSNLSDTLSKAASVTAAPPRLAWFNQAQPTAGCGGTKKANICFHMHIKQVIYICGTP